MNVIGRDERNAEFLADFAAGPIDARLLFHTVGLNLEIEVLLTEDVPIGFGGLARLLVAVAHDVRRDFSGETSAHGDQAVGMLAQQSPVGPRFVIETFQVRRGDNPHEVLIAFSIPGQKDEVMRPLFVGVAVTFAVQNRISVGTGRLSARGVDLAPDDGLDANLGARDVKLKRTVHHTVVGQRQRFHAHRARTGSQVVDTCRSVQETVFRMDVQVDEIGVVHVPQPYTNQRIKTNRTIVPPRPSPRTAIHDSRD